ncbi:MAG TPA: MmcQ/YjbR family DNA-binding protein, partial [Edaphobacter sp.]|nr:MmcQ/YjbR family DNA-binding protein [Edaphobacter sp.]
FSPVQGGWGRMGMTFIHLHQADESLIAGALTTAFHNLQKKQSEKKSGKKPGPSTNPRASSRTRLK